MENSYSEFAQFYDTLMSDADYAQMAEHYAGRLPPPGILLDLACGTGKLSVLMAERGWDVIGVDSSPEMLSCAASHDRVSYICQDMTALDLYGTIDAAICAMDGLNHLTERSELRRALERVSLFMNPGGVFVFDVNTIHKHKTVLGNHTFVKESDDVYCVWRNSYAGDGIIDISLDIFARHRDVYKKHEVEIRERAYSLNTIAILCEQAGFEVLEKIPDEIHDNESEKVVFVCRKAR
jgi:SAM-dependent methyltransferase